MNHPNNARTGNNPGNESRRPDLLDVHVRLTESYLKSVRAGLRGWREDPAEENAPDELSNLVARHLKGSIAFHQTLVDEIGTLVDELNQGEEAQEDEEQ